MPAHNGHHTPAGDGQNGSPRRPARKWSDLKRWEKWLLSIVGGMIAFGTVCFGVAIIIGYTAPNLFGPELGPIIWPILIGSAIVSMCLVGVAIPVMIVLWVSRNPELARRLLAHDREPRD